LSVGANDTDTLDTIVGRVAHADDDIRVARGESVGTAGRIETVPLTTAAGVDHFFEPTGNVVAILHTAPSARAQLSDRCDASARVVREFQNRPTGLLDTSRATKRVIGDDALVARRRCYR
jgi:hypothetical protein